MNALPLSEIETPAVVIDRERLLRNIDWAQGLADRLGVALRPHVKTHKCVEIARLQLERGAAGLTASKADEALVFIAAGVKSITVAYPLIDARKVQRLLSAAREYGTDLRVVVDSRAAVELLRSVASELQVNFAVFVEIDVGLHRCGVSADDPVLLELAHRIRSCDRLRFAGLLSHAGHAYSAGGASEVAQVAAEECELLRRARRTLQEARIEVAEVSVGSTPTVLASQTYDGITEIRPGNYVFMDRTPIRLGLATVDDVALTVVATVVSRNRDHLIIDAGSKVLTSDLGAHGSAGAGGHGVAFRLEQPIGGEPGLTVVRLSEEHGCVEHGGREIAIGAKLRIVPNHACPVVNLADELVVVSGDNEVARWHVAARGKVR